MVYVLLGDIKGETGSAFENSTRAALTDFVVIDMNEASELASDLCANSLHVIDARVSVKAYAGCKDFRRLFLENLDSLYQLCFLLTGDRAGAERCFSAGLDECVKSQYVVKECVHAWAKRTLVQNAIWEMQPRAHGKESPHSAMGALQLNLTSR